MLVNLVMKLYVVAMYLCICSYKLVFRLLQGCNIIKSWIWNVSSFYGMRAGWVGGKPYHKVLSPYIKHISITCTNILTSINITYHLLYTCYVHKVSCNPSLNIIHCGNFFVHCCSHCTLHLVTVSHCYMLLNLVITMLVVDKHVTTLSLPCCL